MKKSLIVLTLAVAACTAMNFQSEAATFTSDRISPHDKAVAALHQIFPEAQDVQWHTSGNEIIAKFNSANGSVRVIYNEKGQPLSTLISSDATHMPFNIRSNIYRQYPGFQPQNMTEYTTSTNHRYYVLLKKQKGNRVSWIRLQSDEDGNLTVMQRLHQVI